MKSSATGAMAARTVLVALALACGLTSLPARAVEVAGVNYPPEVDLQGTRLALNGAGIRYKAIFKVYAAG